MMNWKENILNSRAFHTSPVQGSAPGPSGPCLPLSLALCQHSRFDTWPSAALGVSAEMWFPWRERGLGGCPVHLPSRAKCIKPTQAGENLLFIFIFLEVCIYLAAPGLSCGMRDLVPWPGIEPGTPALGVRSLNRWTTREVPRVCCLNIFLLQKGA